MTLFAARRSALATAFLLAATPLLAQEGFPGTEPQPAPATEAPAAAPAAPAQAAPAPAAEAPAAALPAPAEEKPAEPPAAFPSTGTAATGGIGSLEIFTDVPGAEALVDGNRVGKTPLRVDGLSAGTHRVQITREGGAPLVRDVVVTGGQIARLDAIVAGGPVRQSPGSLGENTTPAAPAPASAGPLSNVPGREFFSTFLEQPWAWAAAGVSFVLLVGAALLWSFSGPSSIPLVGQYLGGVNINNTVWTVVRVVVFVAAVLAGLVALGLFIYPSLPFARSMPLPTISSLMNLGKKPAAAPAQKPAAAAPAPSSTPSASTPASN